jgi:hypothetical protein
MNWHRLFGLLLTDFFTGSPFVVELELDLSKKKQYLDVVVVRKGPGQFVGRLPDGFDDLADHNLITFKSFQEALDDWTLKELTGHYVNYRKQVSPSLNNLLPEVDFRLYGVCSRFPQNLTSAGLLHPRQPGVYECRRGTDIIRIVVVAELPRTENNALLHLLSASADQVRYGAQNYQQRAADTSTLICKLFEHEGMPMPYTMEDFKREFTIEHLKELTTEERVAGLAIEEVMKVFPPAAIKQYLKRTKQQPGSRKGKKKR